MSTTKQKTPVELVPFQQENLSTAQHGIPLPYFAGERVIAGRWLTPALDHKTKQAESNGGKKE